MKHISQEELDKLGIVNKTTITEDIKNIIILFRNELNILERDIDKYDLHLQESIKKKLNNILQYIIKIREKE